MKPTGELWSLMCAIASGDDSAARRILETSPRLAVDAMKAGASRETAASYFLDAIHHYAYAGDTALHIAAAAYRVDITRELVGLGANVAARNRLGAEPLHYASVGAPGSTRGNPAAQSATIEYLIRAGANPNAINKSGVTPLHLAVRSRCAAAVRSLIALGADIRRKNRSGSTPLHLAVEDTGRGGSGSDEARAEQVDIIRILIESGAPLTDTNGRGRTVSEHARNNRVKGILSRFAAA